MELPKVKIGEKDFEITEKELQVLNDYIRTQITLEELSAKLNLASWEEAYQLITTLPTWVFWLPIPMSRKM